LFTASAEPGFRIGLMVDTPLGRKLESKRVDAGRPRNG
jgi:hypothetical protein